MTYDEVQAERAQYAQKLVAKLKAHFGAPFEELISILEKSDDLIDAMVEQANTAAELRVPENDEKVQEATVDLLRFLADGFAGRAGFYGGTASITYGISPPTVFHSMQTSHHLGLEQSVRGHREGCPNPDCHATTPLDKFLHGLRHMMQRVRLDAEEAAERDHSFGSPPHSTLKH